MSNKTLYLSCDTIKDDSLVISKGLRGDILEVVVDQNGSRHLSIHLSYIDLPQLIEFLQEILEDHNKRKGEGTDD